MWNKRLIALVLCVSMALMPFGTMQASEITDVVPEEAAAVETVMPAEAEEAVLDNAEEAAEPEAAETEAEVPAVEAEEVSADEEPVVTAAEAEEIPSVEELPVTVMEETPAETVEETVEEEIIVDFEPLNASPTILVNTITLSGKTTMKAGESDYPTVTILPETVTDKTVTWTSINTAVATVSADGVVYAVAEGTTLIYATANDASGKYAFYELTVTPAYTDDTRVSSVAIIGKDKMNVGETYAISYSILPATAVDKTLSWETSNGAVATVNEFGVVTAVGVGTCTITGVSNSEPNVMDSYLLTVEKVVPVQKINVYLSSTMIPIGSVAYCSWEVFPADASYKTVTWSSSDTSILTVNEYGVVTAVGGGFATITAASTSDSHVYGTLGVTVSIVPVTSISIVGKSTLLVGEEETLACTVVPTTASIPAVVWTSSNPEIASINAQGKVTAVKAGTAIITAKTTDGSNKTATHTLLVTGSKKPVQSITITGQKTMKVSETSAAIAQITPADAYEKGVFWSSDNPAVATVDQGGIVTGVGVGTAMISATAIDGTMVKGTLTVTVKSAVNPVTTVVATGKTSLILNAVDYASYGILPADADDLTVTWSTSNAAVATVDPTYGIVKAVSAGTAIITATANDGSGVTGSYTVTVKSDIVPVTKVAVYGVPSMGVGENQAMSYEIWPANADILSVTWSSSNTKIATVNEYGVVTALKTGVVTIKATSTSNKDVSGSYIISISNTSVPVSRVEIYGSSSMEISDEQYLAYGILPANADNKSVKWSSSNPAIATVDETYGIVKALAVGTVTITAAAKDSSGQSATLTINVTSSAVPVTSVKIYGQASMNLNSTQYMAYEILPANAGNKQVTWSSSVPAVATVDETYGIVKSVGAGSTVITATAKDGSGVTATFNLIVSSALQPVTYVGIKQGPCPICI